MFRRSTIEGTFRASLLVLILSEMTSSIGPLADGIIIASYFLGEKGIAEFEILLASNYLLEAPESCVSGRSFLLSKKGSNWQKGDKGDRLTPLGDTSRRWKCHPFGIFCLHVFL